MIRNPRLASALRMAHSVKHIGSLDAGHANCLLYLAGLKNEKKEEDRGRTNASTRTTNARSTNPRSPYVHFEVGCDGCGAFPIRGAAFRCLDCPDDVGFDLCAECHSSPLVVTGRFDQGHTSNHRVVEREQVRTPLHELQAANPQLGVHEVLDIAGMQLQAAAPPPPDDSSSDDESFSSQEYDSSDDYEPQEYERQREEEYEQRYYGTVVSIKKKNANGTRFAFVHGQHGNIFLHPSDMRSGEGWVYEGDRISFSVGYFENDPLERPKCVDVVRL